ESVEMLGAHEAMARLYSRIGLWGKVVDSLKRQAELNTDRKRARALRLEVASVYEKELAVPERATESYEAILASDPDDEEALAALDRLNEVHSRFEDLQEILAKRAAHAQGKERIDLVRRRAKLLEDKLNNPEAAASALRDLGTDAIADDEMLAALLRNLRRAGLAHEAARALSQRIDIERAGGCAAGAGAPARDHRGARRPRGGLHRSRPHRLGGLQRRRGGAAVPRRGAGAGPQPPARHPGRRRHPLQGRPVGARGEEPDRGG